MSGEYAEVPNSNGKKSKWELKEENRTCLPIAQDLLFDIEDKDYPDYVVKAAKDLVAAIAKYDIEKVSDDVDIVVEEEVEISSDDGDSRMEKMRKQLKKKGVI